jgi:hypothetical protein
MVNTVDARLAALEARMAAVEVHGREVMRTVGIRLEEPDDMIAQMHEVAALEGGVLVVSDDQDGVVVGVIEPVADAVDDAAGLDASAVAEGEVGSVDQQGGDGADTLSGAETDGAFAADSLSGGEG